MPKDATRFAKELKDAYSTSRYRCGWRGCIVALRSREYDDRQIEAIIRSKWTRWAADDKGRPGQATAADLLKWMDDTRNKVTPEEVQELIGETFENVE